MAKTWLLTWTTYGNWLPGDRRGFIGKVRNRGGDTRLRNQFGEPFEAPNEKLERYARSIMKGKPILLNKRQAELILRQFHETATIRGWTLHAVASMPNHVHVVVTTSAEAHPDALLRDLKSYASRALNRERGKALSTSWWTESGSKRERKDAKSVRAAIRYVDRQRGALLIWIAAPSQSSS